MAIKVVVPSLGESIVEATVMQWYKKEGEKVSTGEKLVELETDKVNLDVSADKPGILTRIERQEGADVKVGETLGVIDETAERGTGNGSTSESHAGTASEVQTFSEGAEVETSPAHPSVQIGSERVTPVARRMAEQRGIDIQQLTTARPGGKITKQDVEDYTGGSGPVSAALAHPQTLPKEDLTSKGAVERETYTVIEDEREERVIMSRRRRTIAQRLVEAQHNAAMLTTFNDVNMTQVMGIRQRRKEEFQKKYGVSLGLTSFFVKASVQALKEHPLVNSEIQGDSIVLKHYYDIGVAVGSTEGLVVPVVRNADRLSFVEIEKAIHEYVLKTQSGTLSIEDLRGGTFTITNGGVYGSLMSTPILNAPQVGILGLHRIEDRPVAENGQVVIRPMMYMALSYDHRVIDGQEAVQFLRRIKEIIENPELFILG
jgi:2-oxoglutarate dehydrogenase E2 component (dihydrolipoamide succinyltransferase)